MSDAQVRVLVIDDDAAARALHARFVSETPGFTVTAAAGTGMAAIELGSHGGVDLILLDLRLPDVSGIEVLHRLRTLGTHSPDVMIISSSRDQVTVRQALAGRVAGYLVKPFTYEALAERLSRYRAQHRPSDEAQTHAEREQELAQREIDELLSTGRVQVPSPTARSSSGLPKGIAEVTLRRVLAALDPVTAASASQVAEHASISRASARRYLEHLVSEGRADIAHRYGKRGRPEVLYRLAPDVAQL
ncbi:response regulator [Microbacterium halotolerans]|uniref:response regulator n=1 Tax=Microbacterium halotolerans TaxID=246613 RepID=UPI000E6AA481|nr:response regulator [Microbacterium halotolerans]